MPSCNQHGGLGWALEPTSKFLHSAQRQLSEQNTPAWKHSQYFFRHALFLHVQPLRCLPMTSGALSESSGVTTSSCKHAHMCGCVTVYLHV